MKIVAAQKYMDERRVEKICDKMDDNTNLY
jgi:hypothetical protein